MRDNDNFETDEELDEGPSRSELKRQMLAMQELGQRLAELKPEQWQTLGLSEQMLEALQESKRIKSHNAMRRHIRRLGKLLSQENTDQVHQLLERIDQKDMADTQRFHRLEQWRDRLVAGDDKTISDLLDICPKADRQHIRQLVRASKKELEQQKSPASKRKLFKYLRELDI